MLDIQVQAKDNGMMIVTTLTPNLEWTGGAADLAPQWWTLPPALQLTKHPHSPTLEHS